MSNIRKRMRMGSFDWQEYPIECWGNGNLNSYGGYNSYNNLYYKQFPLLSPTIKVENSTGYHCNCYWYSNNMMLIGNVQSISVSGEYTAPANTAFFSLILYDKPDTAVVDEGQFRILYWGLPYRKPSAKPIMTGSDYLWGAGNWGDNSVFRGNSPYDNMVVRVKQPLLASSIDADFRSCSYSLKITFYKENGTYIAYTTFSAGSVNTGYVPRTDARYYALTLYDKPSAVYARSAPFILTFNE